MKNVAVIFAGGVGTRMYGDLPKQFLEVSEKPIIIQTLELFSINEQIDSIYIACVKDYIPMLRKMIRKFNIRKVAKVFPGGETGQDSIFLGLSKVKKDYENACVVLHDGVRPLVDQATISKCIKDAHKFGCAVTVTPIYETPIISKNGEYVTDVVERSWSYTAQAPQCFNLNEILKWHKEERSKERPYEGVVDSCSLAFKYGEKPHLTIGNRGNIKVTTMEDYLTLIANSAAQNYEQLFILQENRRNAEGRSRKHKN